MVLVTGQKAILSSQQARFQIIDMVAIMKPLTKLSRQIVSASASRRSCARPSAWPPRSGPGRCTSSCPRTSRPRKGRRVPLRAPHPVELPVAHPAAFDRAADMIRRANHPLVMLGAAASRPRLGAMLGDFLARTQHPVLHHPDGQGRRRRCTHRTADRPVDGDGGPLRTRPRARGHRQGRPDPGDRPRHGREAAVPHGARRARGHPRRLHAGERGGGLLPARLGRRRRRPQPDAARRPPGRASSRTPRRCSRCGRASCGGSPRGRRRPVPPRAATHRRRRARGHARRRDRRPGQRHVQDLVRAELPHAASPTPCCWTTRWRPWERGCPRR